MKKLDQALNEFLPQTAGLFLKLYIVYLFICLKRWAVQSR